MSAETAGRSVLIRGGRFVIDDSTILANVTGPSIGAPGTGIDIVVNEDAMIQNAAILENKCVGKCDTRRHIRRRNCPRRAGPTQQGRTHYCSDDWVGERGLRDD